MNHDNSNYNKFELIQNFIRNIVSTPGDCKNGAYMGFFQQNNEHDGNILQQSIPIGIPNFEQNFIGNFETYTDDTG